MLTAMTSYESHISKRVYDEIWQLIAEIYAILPTYMTSNPLFDTRSFKVLVGHDKVSPHLFQGLGGNGLNAQLVLSLGKAQPELAPSRVSRPLAEELRHLSTAVAACQGCLVDIVRALLRRLELLNLLLQLLDLLFSHLGISEISHECSNGNNDQNIQTMGCEIFGVSQLPIGVII